MLKKIAVITGLLFPILCSARGIDVNWTGPNNLTVQAQPDGVVDSTTICKRANTIFFYVLTRRNGGMRQHMFASTPGVSSGSCGEALGNVLPYSFTVPDGEYFYGIGKTINGRQPDGTTITVSLDWSSGGGDGWKPQQPAGPACSLGGSSVSINYGDIQANEVSGLEKSANLYISCNARTTVKVSIAGYSPNTGIRLLSDGSLTAKVYVRGNEGNTGSTEIVDANTFSSIPITSVLQVNGALNGGAFRGSAIIRIDIN